MEIANLLAEIQTKLLQIEIALGDPKHTDAGTLTQLEKFLGIFDTQIKKLEFLTSDVKGKLAVKSIEERLRSEI